MRLLDTDICIHWLKGHPLVRRQMQETTFAGVSISVVTKAELHFGVYYSSIAHRMDNLHRTERLLENLAILPLEDEIVRRFGELKADLRRSGTSIPDFDLLIAATALATGRVLVTNNDRHFNRIPGLTLENWVKSE